MPFSIYVFNTRSQAPVRNPKKQSSNRQHTGYVICNIDRAAAASSPHMISLTTISPARSSERKMGRPTMEGYECSGKFYRTIPPRQYKISIFCTNTASPLPPQRKKSIKLTCAAYPTLRNPVPPSRTGCRFRQLFASWIISQLGHTYGCLCHFSKMQSRTEGLILAFFALCGGPGSLAELPWLSEIIRAVGGSEPRGKVVRCSIGTVSRRQRLRGRGLGFFFFCPLSLMKYLWPSLTALFFHLPTQSYYVRA